MASGPLDEPIAGLPALADERKAIPRHDLPPDLDDIWQGYMVRRTNSPGIEMRVQTRMPGCPPRLVWVMAFIAVMLVWLLARPWRGYAVSTTTAMITGLAGSVLLAFWITRMITAIDQKFLLNRKLETVEVRQDGITFNRQHFFKRAWIRDLRVGITSNLLRGSDYNCCLVALVGTRRMEFLKGMDGPTGRVLGEHLEKARRTFWAD